MARSPLLVLLALFACNRDAPSSDETPPGKAPKSEAVLQKRAEARLQAEQKAADEAARRAADIDALVQLPMTQPKTLPKACDAMVAAYDAYMRRVLTDDMLLKWTTGGNEMQVKVFRKECLTRAIPVAACQAAAFAKMTRDQYPLLADMMGACLTKHGGG